MYIMPVRLGILSKTYHALCETGISLLKNNMTTYRPIEESFGGDIGCTYFITKLAYCFDLSLSDAILYWYGFLVGTASIIAFLGLSLHTKKLSQKLIAACGVFIFAYVSWKIGDEYVVGFCVASWIPLTLNLFESKKYKALLPYLFILGGVCCYYNFLRIHTGTLLALAFCIRFFCYKETWLKKIGMTVFFCVGFLCAYQTSQLIFKTRNTLLQEHGVVYTKTNHIHTFWHNVYPGLGFIENDKNLYFDDNCSAQKVYSIDPEAYYLTEKYNDILRNEVVDICLHSPHFVMRNLFAKLGVLFYYLLLCLLPFLWIVCAFQLPLRMQLTYAGACLWGALPGVLTIPNALYLVGFIATVWYYGLHTLILALERNTFAFYANNIKKFCVQLFHRVRLMVLD